MPLKEMREFERKVEIGVKDESQIVRGNEREGRSFCR